MLLLGLGGAGAVYWRETRAPDLSDDLALVGYNRAESRQMGMLYGKEGVMLEDFQNDLKQPGTQAALLATASAIIASGCFYFARLLAHDAEAGG